MELGSLKVQTSTKVYKPSDDTFLAAIAVEGLLAKMKGKGIRVLDIGTGTGALGLAAGTNGRVTKITFGDINSNAVKLAQKNYLKNKKLIGAKCDFVKMDLFQKAKGKYDLIIFNTPYLPKDENSNTKILSKAWEGGEGGIETTIRFLGGLKKHLTKNGKAVIVVSSFGNLKELRREIIKRGFKSRMIARKHLFFEDIIVMQIVSG